MIESDNYKSAKELILKAVNRRIREYEPEILGFSEKQPHLKIKAFYRLENDLDIDSREIISAYADILTDTEKNKLESVFKDKIHAHFFDKE